MQKFSETIKAMHLRYSVGWFLLAVTSAASYAAEPVLVYCSNCSPSQVETAVTNVSAPIGTTIYVGDTVTEAVGAYQVYMDVDDSKRPPVHTREVTNVSADSTITGGVYAAIQFYKTAPIGWHKKLSVVYTGSDPDASGWTVSNTGAHQTNFNTWLNTAGSGAKTLSQVAGVATQALSIVTHTDQNASPTEEITVTFSDGSKTVGVQNFACGCLKDDPSQSTDAEGNPIPYIDSVGHVHNAGGVRQYGDDYQSTVDYNNWIKQISHFPIIVQDPSGTQIGGGGTTGGSGTIIPTICTETEDDKGKKTETCFLG